MENHKEKETVFVDYNPSDIRVGRFPTLRSNSHDSKSTSRSNRYLHYQKTRIAGALNKGEIERAVLIWLCLLKLSKSYQMLIYTKVKKQWYIKENKLKIKSEIIGLMNQCRAFRLTMDLKRWYLLKPNGKYRPIGSPTIGSKVISKMLTDLWTTLADRHRGEMQHAFRPNRGVWSAAFAVCQKLKNRTPEDKVIEFDLKGFFNTVSRHSVEEAAGRFSLLLRNCLRHIIDNTRYAFEELKPETELIQVDYKHWKNKNKLCIYRRGVPQGLPLSPLAATMALENEVNMPEITMYADDGILIAGENKFKEFVQKAVRIGAEIAPEKTGVVDKEFKFLGLTFNLEKETVSNENSFRFWSDKDLIPWLKKQAAMYSKTPEQWDWEVDGGSYIKKHEVHVNELDWWTRLAITWLGRGSIYKGLIHNASGEIYYVSGSSSLCCEDLLKDAVSVKLRKVLPFHWKIRKDAQSQITCRYIELGNDWDGWYNANKMNWNLHKIWENS